MDEDDVFKVGGGAWKTRFTDYDTKFLYVIPNKYPAFIESAHNISPRPHGVEDDFYTMRPALGGHDVIVIKSHEHGPTKFDIAVWRDLFSTFKKRYSYYNDINPNIYVMPIYNHKPEAAASIWHPHAQIFASTIVPNMVHREIEHTQRYFEHNGHSAFADMIAHEKKKKTRVIAENHHFIAFTFYAARFPFEIWIVPKFQQASFANITTGAMQSLAKICRAVFGKLDKVLEDPPLNFFIHSAPTMEKNVPYYRWHMEIGPRLANYGGFELGAGMVIDVVSPEKAAMYLRGEEVE